MIPPEIHAEILATLLAPIQSYLHDPSVSEVMINGPQQIYVERKGKLERTLARFDSAEAVLAALRNIAQFAGVFIDETNPILEARLPDGSRVEAVIAPVVDDGPVLSIRRFAKTTLTLEQLVQWDSLSEAAAAALLAMTCAKRNIVVAGGTGSGKTSLLNVLTGCIPDGERVLVLEDTREIDVAHAHVVYLQARNADAQGRGAIAIRDLFRASLRLRPDRIVVGEIRGAEALDMIQAMVSGHGGCLSTLHASYPRDTLTRLETMCMMSDVNMPLPAIRAQIGSGIDIIVQAGRLVDGSRKITHITEVVGFDAEHGGFVLRDLFVRRYHGQADDGALRSTLEPTGELPSFAEELAPYAQALPESMLRAHRARSAAGSDACLL